MDIWISSGSLFLQVGLAANPHNNPWEGCLLRQGLQTPTGWNASKAEVHKPIQNIQICDLDEHRCGAFQLDRTLKPSSQLC